jgi:HK97 family phage major capsid protein
MNRIKELNEKRGAKLKEAASIIETATTEKRELTGEEASRVNAFHDEAENIAVSIAAEARSLAAMSASMPQLSRQEQKDVRSFDFAKVLTHLHRSAKGGMTSLDGIEAEMIQEGEREARSAGVQAGGILLPRMLVRRESRDMTATGTTSTTGDQGGMTVATNKAGLLDDFFNASILRGLGSTVLEGLQGNLDIPRIIAGTDPAKKAENAAADEVSPTTAMLSLSPKRLPAYIDISEQLLNQSSSAIEAILRGHLTTQMGAIREKAFFHGGGTNEPTGIAGTSGIGSIAGGTNGAAPVWTHLTGLEEKVDAQNALLGSLAYASNGQIRKKLKETPRQSSGVEGNFLLNDAGMVNGYRMAFTNAISRTLTKGSSSGVASAIFFGNFADFYEAYWGGVSLELVRDKTNAIGGLYTLVASVYYDGGVVRPKSFAAMLDALGA